MIAHFGLKSYEIPSNYLVPRIPQRLAYLYWIKNLFDIADESIYFGGFDIGVGANCIYPILG
jgi:23S rRNA (adenine1618-N6)-methyltransferase